MTLVIGAGGAATSLARFTAADVDELIAMHDRCSADTRYGRWHGHTKRFPPRYLRQLIEEDVAIVARRDDVVIGLASAAPVPAPPGPRAHAGMAAEIWEIGLLVEDAWQRRGVGGQLLTEIVTTARTSGAGVIRAEVLDRDIGLLEPLRRLGPTRTHLSHGVATADVTLPT